MQPSWPCPYDGLCTAKPTASLTLKQDWASLPESGRAFIQGFVAAVVRQKEADGFEVVTTYFAGHLNSDCAFDLEGKLHPSAEGDAGALCTGTPAPAVLWQWLYSWQTRLACSQRLLGLRLCTAVRRGISG